MDDYAYKEFIDGVTKYYGLYNGGLKKQGNAYLKEFMQKFRALPEEEKNKTLYTFCRFVCDTEEGEALLSRGNGELPFELKKAVLEYLLKECEKDNMPHLQWYFRLFKNFRQAYESGAPDIGGIIKRAYNHKERDLKTSELYFRYWLDILSWGAHHFPEGCLIDGHDCAQALETCKQIADEARLSENLLEELEYNRKLYRVWERYLSDGKKREFKEYCAEEGLNFVQTKTIYY